MEKLRQNPVLQKEKRKDRIKIIFNEIGDKARVALEIWPLFVFVKMDWNFH